MRNYRAPPDQHFLGADDGIRTRDPHLGKVRKVVQGVRFRLLRWAFVHLVVRPVRSYPLCSRAVYLGLVVLVAPHARFPETAADHEDVRIEASAGQWRAGAQACEWVRGIGTDPRHQLGSERRLDLLAEPPWLALDALHARQKGRGAVGGELIDPGGATGDGEHDRERRAADLGPSAGRQIGM